MISNFEKIKFKVPAGWYVVTYIRTPQCCSAFPALLIPDFCPPVLGGFSRYPECSRGLSLLQPCCSLSVADGRAPISRTLEGFEGLQPQAGFIQMSAPVWCCIMSKNYILKVPEELRPPFKVETSTRALMGFPLTSEGKDIANILNFQIFL